jgi:hypothetical protein
MNMTTFAIRIFLFTLFPLILALIVKQIDKSVDTKTRFYELTLVFLFGIGVAGSGVFNFFAHFFVSDVVANSIGWEPGSPFQLEVAFANLALGGLGVIAAGRRDGFREATVIAATVFSVGATVVHLMDIVAAGNLAPGNTIQNFGNILKPFLLIWFLRKLRNVERTDKPIEDGSKFDQWRVPLLTTSAPLAISISTGYGVGFALDQVWLFSIIGVIVGVGIVVIALSRSPIHKMIWNGNSNKAS